VDESIISVVLPRLDESGVTPADEIRTCASRARGWATTWADPVIELASGDFVVEEAFLDSVVEDPSRWPTAAGHGRYAAAWPVSVGLRPCLLMPPWVWSLSTS